MHQRIKQDFLDQLPTSDYCSLRLVCLDEERLLVKKGRVENVSTEQNLGLIVTVIKNGGLGYGSTCQIDRQGIHWAMEQACQWAELSASQSVFDYSQIAMPHPQGHYQTKVSQPWESESLENRLDRLLTESAKLKISDEIVNWGASLSRLKSETLFLTSEGGEAHQLKDALFPDLFVTGFKNEAQHRHLAGSGNAQQGGLELLDNLFDNKAPMLAEQVLQLLAAPQCPEDPRDLLLMPDQMMLQIHESIGHPLELDRILGDERNYAGTSFVTADMIGSFQYGSELLNVSFDPTLSNEFASYGFDDDGSQAEKQLIIEKGILKRVLGGHISQNRAGLPGVACSRSQNWNRPPLDRMANLNIEPGTDSLQSLISGIEKGVLMESNRSWSIDDSRNKFQFGCEWGQLIENGELTTVVKNPNYRGISSGFWRNLKAVGNQETFAVHGTPWCGKAEPNQVIQVGHASPACVFANVEVFGG